MERATPGLVYEFDNIPVEVRAVGDSTISTKTTKQDENGWDLSIFRWLAWLTFALSLVLGAGVALAVFILKRMP